jgi:alpha-D-ribose 1-methylphosphonate 5-triphosphate diphosphatase
MNSHILTAERVVTPEWDDAATVVVEDGVIVEILRGRRYAAAEDLGDCWLTPGCVDIHSDYLEREIRPRPSAEFPLDLAFHYMDQRAVACGLTTVMSAIAFTDKSEAGGRSFATAIEQARSLETLAENGLARHFVHARLDPNTDGVLAWLDEIARVDALKLVVYNDSVPGQRQFRYEDLVVKRAASQGITEDAARAMLDAQIAERSRVNHREAISEKLVGRSILGSHDDTTAAHVDEAHAFGATLSEMPTTMEAARRARQLDLWICMGAPNLVRGGSHCGNLACADAMAEDLVDMLCSDYHFPSLHGAVVRMLKEGVAPSRCFELVALNPARLLGLGDELGSIEVGKRADLVAFRAAEGFTRVQRVWVDGAERFRAAAVPATPAAAAAAARRVA